MTIDLSIRKLPSLLKEFGIWSRERILNSSQRGRNNQVEQLKENRNNDAKVFVYVQQQVGDIIFPRTMDFSKAKEACDILREEFKAETIKLPILRREFAYVKIKYSESLKDYLSRLRSC